MHDVWMALVGGVLLFGGTYFLSLKEGQAYRALRFALGTLLCGMGIGWFLHGLVRAFL